jgi:predicted TIM-barrel fold metal-dependent hydrolase
LNEFRGLFSESDDPRQWPHVAFAVTYRRAIGVLARHFACSDSEAAVFAVRRSMDVLDYAASLLRATGTETLLIDDGFPEPSISVNWRELGEVAGCRARPVLRLETFAGDVSTARAEGFVALKTILAYRGGLADVPPSLVAALEANEATGAPLPVQVHTGFGDADLSLPLSRPGLLKPLIERFDETPFVLLHCYPFIREAGWLAHVYPNVWFDLSLTIPHVARPVEALYEALELAPYSKLLYASDAARTPELYLLGALWWRDALAVVLPDLFGVSALEAAVAILRENALGLYSL